MNKGVLYTLIAYGLWGFNPIYFKLLQDVSPLQIMSHRVVWSFILLLVLLLLRREISALIAAARLRVLLIYLGTGVLLAVNWLIYVWVVNSGHVVEGSLGYFINPLVSVVLGLVFLKEKLRPVQWLPVGLAVCGVVYLTVSYGTVPWSSLALAFTFGFYGLMKKIAPLGSLHGLSLETALVLPPVLVYLLVIGSRGESAFTQGGFATALLLVGCGAVTVIPLLMFAHGAHRVPLTTMGLLMYITPTIQFLTGVFLYHEPFDLNRAIGFAIIWLALIIFSVDGIYTSRRSWASSAV